MIDFSHSTIGLAVRHMMVSRIHGTFVFYSETGTVADLENMDDVQTQIDRRAFKLVYNTLLETDDIINER